MSIAKRTRAAINEHPFLVEALRADVVNYTAAARFLDVGEAEAVAAALRRYANELPPQPKPSGASKVRMITGLGREDTADDALLKIDGASYQYEAGTLTAILVDREFSHFYDVEIRWQLRENGIDAQAIASTADQFIIVTERKDGPTTLRLVEEALTADSRD